MNELPKPNSKPTPELDSYINSQVESLLDKSGELLAYESMSDQAREEQADKLMGDITAFLDNEEDVDIRDVEVELTITEDIDVLKQIIKQDEHFPDFNPELHEMLMQDKLTGGNNPHEVTNILDKEITSIITNFDERINADLSDETIKARKLEVAAELQHRYGELAEPLVRMIDIMNGRGAEVSSMDPGDVLSETLEVNGKHPGREEKYRAIKTYVADTKRAEIAESIKNHFGFHDDGREDDLVEAILSVGMDLAVTEWELNNAKDINPAKLSAQLDAAIERGIQRLDAASMNETTAAQMKNGMAISSEVHGVYDTTEQLIRRS